MKQRESPYRRVYDDTRELYDGREGWTPGHSHAASLRKVGKEIRPRPLVGGGVVMDSPFFRVMGPVQLRNPSKRRPLILKGGESGSSWDWGRLASEIQSASAPIPKWP